MQFFHRGYVAEFCTVPQCSRSSYKNGDDFDVFMILAISRFKSVLEGN